MAERAGAQTNRTKEPIRFEQCLVVAPENFEVAVQETGTIANLVVTENSYVQRGEAIGSLSSETLALEKEVAGLQYQVAHAEATDESDIRFAEMVAEEAKLQLDAYEGMSKKGDASLLEVRQKRIAWEQAKVRIVQARAIKVQKELKAKLSKAAYDLAEKKLERLKFTSPVDGQVTRIDHRSGEWVTAGTPLLKIVRMDELRVDFFIDLGERDPNDLIGIGVELEWAKDSRSRFIGTITSYAPEVSATGKVRMSATVKNQKTGPNWLLLPGMNVTLTAR